MCWKGDFILGRVPKSFIRPLMYQLLLASFFFAFYKFLGEKERSCKPSTNIPGEQKFFP